MVQGHDHAAFAPQLQVFRHHGQGGAGKAGVGVKPAEGVEMPFGGPYGGEAIFGRRIWRFQLEVGIDWGRAIGAVTVEIK